MNRTWCSLILAGVFAGGVGAQQPATPPALELPAGMRARVQSITADGWLVGTLARADGGSIELVPEGRAATGGAPLRLSSATVTRLEVSDGQRRHWLRGLVVGGVVGILAGLVVDVDPVACKTDDAYACSRAEGVGSSGSGGALAGLLIGGLFKTERWIPVALDALGPAPNVPTATLGLRAAPARGAVQLSVSLPTW